MEENLMSTCLYDKHIALGAQMSPFGGFMMPIQYSSITEEHNAVRKAAGMFDVSHMGEIFVSGSQAEEFVNYIFSNDIAGIPEGKVLYGMMLNPQGGVVDDLLVYKEFEAGHFLLVVNASNIAKDYAWLREHAAGFDVTVNNASDIWGEVALQGPEAERYAVEVLGLEAVRELTFYTYKEMSWKGERLIVSRTGYTGEDGFELYGSHAAVNEIWDMLLAAGVTPCGLGCRDTLRFEAGLPLYGHELADDISPAEAGLGLFVKTDKQKFIGKDAYMALKATGITRKIVGVELEDKAIARGGYIVEADGREIGVVTTGYRSISLDKSVCVAMLDKAYTELGSRVEIQIRKKKFPGTVCKKRFYTVSKK